MAEIIKFISMNYYKAHDKNKQIPGSTAQNATQEYGKIKQDANKNRLFKTYK
jgi:hypothetical protein